MTTQRLPVLTGPIGNVAASLEFDPDDTYKGYRLGNLHWAYRELRRVSQNGVAHAKVPLDMVDLLAAAVDWFCGTELKVLVRPQHPLLPALVEAVL